MGIGFSISRVVWNGKIFLFMIADITRKQLIPVAHKIWSPAFFMGGRAG
jgi:hypothetical protein